MAAHRTLDRRRDDPCVGELRKRVADLVIRNSYISSGNSTTEKWGTNFPQREVVGYIPLMCDWCAGAGSWYGVVVSARTRAGSTSESLAQETSAIATTESAETRIIDFFMAGTVVDATGQFNRRTP